MIDRVLLVSVLILLVIGLIMSYSLPIYYLDNHNLKDYTFFIKQSIAVIIGTVLMVGISQLDAKKWFPIFSIYFFVIFFFILLIMVFLPNSIVPQIAGAKRWINLKYVFITPSEYYKVGFLLFISWSLARTRFMKNIIPLKEEIKIFSPYLAILFINIILLGVFQNDLGQSFILMLLLFVIFILSGSSVKFISLYLGSILLIIITLIITFPYRFIRIKEWIISLSSNSNRLESYQVSNSLDAIHNGWFFGQGIGNSHYKLGYLPEIHTDFVLSGMIEELGVLSILLVVALMALISYRILKIASQTNIVAYYFFCTGATVIINTSFIINSFGITGITPIKGIAVPFLSYGGSQVIAYSILIGFVLMISRTVKKL